MFLLLYLGLAYVFSVQTKEGMGSPFEQACFGINFPLCFPVLFTLQRFATVGTLGGLGRATGIMELRHRGTGQFFSARDWQCDFTEKLVDMVIPPGPGSLQAV